MAKQSMRFIKKEHGQAVAELAITLPIFLMILCGIIDFGWLFGNQLSLSYCCREGARYGIVNSEGAIAAQNIKDKVISETPDYLKDKITVTVTFSDASAPRDGDLCVKISANIDTLTPVAGIFSGGETVTISSQCVMKVE
ncbi:MAG: pilus assembly protein [Bacillota bacterium]|nr:pilus assembly protein [Bacillota bacterium]